MFFCRDCGGKFDNPGSYEETHGLEYGPYECVVVCPYCGSDNFTEINIAIEKIEIAEIVVPMIQKLNKFVDGLENFYGTEIKNSDLLDCIDDATGLIADMFDYMDVDLKKNLLKMKNENQADRILMKLRGDV